MSFRLTPKLVTLNGVMALVLCYFTEFGSFRGALRKSGRRRRRRKSSSHDEFLVLTALITIYLW